jgi:hypothetical protein
MSGSGVDDGGDVGALGGDGLHDEVQRSVEISRAWSTMSTVSWNDEEARPEFPVRRRHSGWDRCVDSLRKNGQEKCYEVRLEEGRR